MVIMQGYFEMSSLVTLPLKLGILEILWHQKSQQMDCLKCS